MEERHDICGQLCFIATAAYGTPMTEEIDVLRDFRDAYLLTNPVGEALVEFYYSTSPPIADFIAEHSALRAAVRSGLLPVVTLSKMAVGTAVVHKLTLLGLLALLSATLVAWLRQRRTVEVV